MVWIAAFDSTHDNHSNANRILTRYLSKYREKSLFLSDYNFSEITRYITYKQKNENLTIQQRQEFLELVRDSIYNSRYVKILKVSDTDIGTAFNCMLDHPNLTASLADWISLILMVQNNIPAIVTFDRDFKAIIASVKQFMKIKVWDR